MYSIDPHMEVSDQHNPRPDMDDLRRRGHPATFGRFTDACKRHGVWDLVHPILDDSACAWKRWPADRTCDLLLIDGNPDTAMQDFSDWAPLLLPGATVCFHDYGNPHVPKITDHVDKLAAASDIAHVETVGSLYVARVVRPGTKERKQGEPGPRITQTYRPMERIAALETELSHLRHTRSWRWTAPLRRLEALLRGHPRTVTRAPSASPAPGPVAPRLPQTPIVSRMPRPAPAQGLARVAVVITSHNYGHYLPDAIESVLDQSVPAEIVVVDDASSDDTRAVTERYAGNGVRYLRGEWRSVGAARNAGLAATAADHLVFLDADDLLHPHYLRQGLEVLDADPQAAIAFTDHRCFGARQDLLHLGKAFDWRRFDRSNQLHAACMVRRTALVQVGGWSHGVGQHADWVTWRRVLRTGWTAVRSEAMHFYRMHADGSMRSRHYALPYATRTGLLEEPAELFLALSGRAWAWPLTAKFLERQTFPHNQLRLVLLDTSQDPAFGQMVRTWLAGCDYRGHTYLAEIVAPKGIADLPRAQARQEVADACVRIYSRFSRLSTTTLALFLEDDVIPPDDAYPRLVSRFEEDVVSVSGLYHHRGSGRPVAWDWTAEGGAVEAAPGEGVCSVGGTGFGCLALRGEELRHAAFSSGPPTGNYDQNFFRTLTHERNDRALLDRNCLCRHHSDATTWK